jgi:hypothetical protein
MAGWGDAAGAVFGWFSPEQRAKAKRAKLEALKEEREKIMKKPNTPELAKRIQKIDIEITVIDRDLRS